MDKFRNDLLNNYKNAKRPYGIFHGHISYDMVDKYANIDLNALYYIIAERSPYSKILSLVTWRKNRLNYLKDKKIFHFDKKTIQNEVDLYLENGKIYDVYNYNLYSKRKPDFIIKYENLYFDLKKLVKIFNENINLSLPHYKKGMLFCDKDAVQYLRKDQIEKINELFFQEFSIYLQLRYDNPLICRSL